MDPSLIEKVRVERILFSNVGFVLLLRREENADDALLPIFIGGPEAHSIAAAYNNRKFPRPFTHDLFKNTLELLDCTIEQVIITDLVESTFLSKVYMRRADETFKVDARPSDAIAMALRFKAPIFASKAVLASAAFQPEDVEESPVEMDTVQQLKNELEAALEEERYEDAARIRDELKKLQNDN